MKTVITVVLAGFVGLSFAMDESQEPQVQYTLEINGQEHGVLLNKPLEISGVYENPKVLLKAEPTRHFSYGGIAFQYPASFSWEAEIEAQNQKTWVLSGNDFKIMYFVLPQAISVDSYIQAIAKQFGAADTRISDAERTIGGNTNAGKLLFVKVAGAALKFEVYALPAELGSKLLVFQDSPPDDKVNSEESKTTLALFLSSFKQTGH